MNLRGKKGSIAIFVLVALLFMASFLIIMFSSNINKAKVVKEQIDIIRQIYGKSDKGEEIAYEPEIKDLPKEIWVGYTEVAESYVDYHNIEKEEEQYIIVAFPDTIYSTMTELVEFAAGYLLENNISEIGVDIKVIAKGKNNTIVESTQTITFKFPRPKINSIPEEIFINYTEVAESYVEKNGVEIVEEQYIIVDLNNETYSTMTKVVNRANEWLVANGANEVKDVKIKVIAKGKNNTIVELTQEITFKLPLKPIIDTLPSEIVIGQTPVKESYVTYDSKGSQKETYTIVDLNNETYSTMTEVVNRANEWLLLNNAYSVEGVAVKIEATGVTNLSSESVQTIKFTLAPKMITSHTELIEALSSPIPSYIKIAEDITLTEDIMIDGVTHTLDLNGKTMSRTTTDENFTLLTIGPGANITISDTSANQDGKILAAILETTESIGESIENSITCIKNFGELTIEPGINIVAEGKVIMEKAKENTAVDITITAITNDGILNLNGGTVYASTITQACSDTLVRNSRATAYGINSSGTVNLNSGSITANAEAYAVKTGWLISGQNFATAYGIRNNDGTVNGNGVIFKTTAHADKSNATITDSDGKDIKNT